MCNFLIIEKVKVNLFFTFERISHTEIKDNGIYIVSDNELMFLPADTVIMAVGARPENELFKALQGTVPDLYAIGDCARVRNAKEAISEGYELGLKI